MTPPLVREIDSSILSGSTISHRFIRFRLPGVNRRYSTVVPFFPLWVRDGKAAQQPVSRTRARLRHDRLGGEATGDVAGRRVHRLCHCRQPPAGVGASCPDPTAPAAIASRSSPFAPAAPADAAPIEEKLTPLGQSVMVTNSLTLRANPNGHVYVTATVNNVPIKFMVDTGATWVSLSPGDAARARSPPTSTTRSP